MKIDQELLKKITAQSLANKPTGIKGLINSIHKNPKLREWLTLESIALPPIPFPKGNHWHLLTLLVTRKTLEDGTQIFNPPWATIEWILPQKTVVQIQDLRSNDAINQLKSQHQQPIKINPVDSSVKFDRTVKLNREDALFKILDQIDSQTFDLKHLAPYYAGLLPKEIYDYYWLLIPESKNWLNPNVTAIRLVNSSDQELPDIQEENLPSEIEIREENKSLSSKLPSDFSIYLNDWLSELQTIANSYNLSEISNQLNEYEYRLLQPRFRLAIVGEFSRGKSNLINTILKDNVVPTGNLPTTSTLISIFPDKKNQIEVYLPNNNVEIRPVSEESWKDLLAVDPTGNNQEILAKIRVKLNNSWLEKLDVELIDTPGASDLSDRRSALVFDLLSQCDGAVLVISATMALSLTEIAFLEEQIIGRHIPRVLVVVSKLDLIKPEERATVFEHIRDRLAKISPDIPIVSLHPVDDKTSELDTTQAIKNHLEKMANQSERQIWRSHQIANQLIDSCQQLKQLGESAIANGKLDQAQRQKEIHKMQQLIQDAEIYWQQLELDLERKRIKNYQQLEKKIIEVKNNLLEILKFQIKKATNPKAWWQDDLPFILRKELVTFSRNIENSIVERIARDNSWLEEKVQEYFGQEIATVLPVSNYNLDIITDVENLPLADLQKYRLLTRLGSSAAIIGGYVLGGPIGIIASTGIWLLGENLMNKTIEEQKQLIQQELQQKMDSCFNKYSQKVAERLQQVYKQIIQEIRQEEKVWKQNQQILVENSNFSNSQEEVKKWAQLINQVNNLQTTIINSTSKS